MTWRRLAIASTPTACSTDGIRRGVDAEKRLLPKVSLRDIPR